MEKEFYIITNNSKFGNSFVGLLPEGQYRTSVLTSLITLTDESPIASTCIAAVDIDSFEPDIQRIRALKKKFSNLVLLAFSERKFHPEHKEVLSEHFFACLTKPIDMDELLYLIKDL